MRLEEPGRVWGTDEVWLSAFPLFLGEPRLLPSASLGERELQAGPSVSHAPWRALCVTWLSVFGLVCFILSSSRRAI